MSVTLLWYFLKRSPKFIIIILNFITIFLTFFLLTGCYNEQNKNTFLVKYQFNKHSSFFPIIKQSYDNTNSNKTQGLENIVIRSGYMGICIDNIPNNYNLHNQPLKSTCYPRKNISDVSFYNDLMIKISSVNSQNSSVSTDKTNLNILKLAQITSVNIIHPYILGATIILSLIHFLLLFYLMIPHVPLKKYINKPMFLLSLIMTLLWGIGATWTHIAVHSAFDFIPEASMNIIKVKKGKKAALMSWFSFSFLLLISCILFANEWKNSQDSENENAHESDKENIYNYHYYSSDGSSFGTKV
ncbi:Fig1p PWA37_000752 [Arxiozyma heterogenica]|uniref:Fig1p n=1 Tax=Arxiozyma heterogenica TaxID=278026 RepID=UPI002F163431